MKFTIISILIFSSIVTSDLQSKPAPTVIPLHTNGKSTLYVTGKFGELSDTELMVDTGSAYVTINEDTLGKLKQKGQATYIKQIRGILANGSTFKVQVWKLSSLTINNQCVINDIEAAVFPGKTRQILGLSALRKTAPFTISIKPASISLSDCDKFLAVL